MKEDFLQYVWENALFKSNEFLTVSGQVVTVLQPGRLNRDAGADFFNARIRIGEVELAGNVEVHLRNSDWIRHRHHEDAAYDNVILSVVREADCRIFNRAGREVETIVLDDADALYEKYLRLQEERISPRCFGGLEKVDRAYLNICLQSALIARLERKYRDIERILEQTANDWEECFYRLFCKYWTGNLNAEPFYRLALALPYRVVLRYADRQTALEALFLGCAGFLEETPDDYSRMLRREFDHLRVKHDLSVLAPEQWKFMRLRPDACPPVRLALLAAFIHRSGRLVSRILEVSSLAELCKLLEVSVSPYWESHYRPGMETSVRKKQLGETLRKVLIINAVIPFLFAYGKKQGDESCGERALAWLEELKAEENYIIKNWRGAGVACLSAAQSQALIEVTREYCERHRCLQCRIGLAIMKKR